VEEYELIIGWPVNSPEVCIVLSSCLCLCFFLLQSPFRYISSIDSVSCCLFWGWCEDHRKISWADSDSVCMSKEKEGLGVRR
jgi:hypothetical protein